MCLPGHDAWNVHFSPGPCLEGKGFYFPSHGLRCQKNVIIQRANDITQELEGTLLGRLTDLDRQVLSWIRRKVP